MAKDLLPDIVQVYVDDDGDYRWRRVSPNGKKLSNSGEGYARPGACLNMLHHVNARPFELHFNGKRGRSWIDWIH